MRYKITQEYQKLRGSIFSLRLWAKKEKKYFISEKKLQVL